MTTFTTKKIISQKSNSGSSGGGTILGSVGATNGLVPFGNGTANTIQSSINFLYTESGLNSFFTVGNTRNDIPMFVTNRVAITTAFNTDFDPNIVSARTIPDSIITNSHGFVEATVFKSTTGNLANNAFTDNGILTDPTGGAGNYNHHASYQSQVKLNNTGTTGNLYFCADAPTVNNGILTNRYGFYFYDGVGTGTITNQYGLYVPTLAKGATTNEAIHVVSNPSYFGGAIKMVTTSGGANVIAPAMEWYHATTIKTSWIADKIINNTSELKFNVSTYNFAGYKEMLTLHGDDNNTNSDYALLNATKTFVGGTSTPTSILHISAGSATANTAPLQITNGQREAVARGGLYEYENNHYKTNNSLVRYGLGGTIKDFITDVANTNVTTEQDIYTYTTLANTLAMNGDKIDAEYGLQLTSTGGLTKQLRAYFGGTLIFDSGALSLSVATDFCVNLLIIRDGSTSVRCVATANTTGASTNAYAKVTKITGLTLSNTNILKVTGTVGTGAVAGDITGVCGMIEIKANA